MRQVVTSVEHNLQAFMASSVAPVTFWQSGRWIPMVWTDIMPSTPELY
jgi:hypothetical protein